MAGAGRGVSLPVASAKYPIRDAASLGVAVYQCRLRRRRRRRSQERCNTVSYVPVSSGVADPSSCVVLLSPVAGVALARRLPFSRTACG